MDIGGHDIVLKLTPFGADRELILRYFKMIWRDACYEDGEGSYLASASEAWRFAPRTSEFFVFKDRAAREAWLADGATPANADTMVHVLFGEHSMTFVVDSPHSLGARLVAELQTNLRSVPAALAERSVA